MLSVCRKSLAEFAAHRQQRIEIIFSHDMCVRENTSQASSVEFLRLWHTNYARSRLQAFCRKNPEDFSDSLREPAAKAAGSLCVENFLHAGAFLRTSKSFQKMGTKKAALTAASLAEQKDGKRKGRKQMKRGKCDYL